MQENAALDRLFKLMSAPMLVLVIAAGVGAYVGSLIGAMSHMRGGGRVPRKRVASRVSRFRRARGRPCLAGTQQKAARVSRDSGGLSTERATGHWQQGRWS
nr:hypothetical protein [Paraburkholderia sp. BL10I2N1]